MATDLANPPPVAAAEYIAAIAQHVSSVCVVATELDGERFGLTATAVASVCAEPPRLLVCINRNGFTHDRIIASRRFCVNVLAEEQHQVAMAFAGMAGRAADRFRSGSWTTLKTGAPVLAGAVAAFDCLLHETCEQSTHTVLFGNVVATASHGGDEALLYGGRRFRQLRKIFSGAPDGVSEYL